jgi:hypothetical protein
MKTTRTSGSELADVSLRCEVAFHSRAARIQDAFSGELVVVTEHGWADMSTLGRTRAANPH